MLRQEDKGGGRMNLIYDEKTETWDKAPEYSVTIYFDTEEDRDKFIADMRARYAKKEE